MTFQAHLSLRIASAAALLITPHLAFSQGKLTPPAGPPGPTMQTLDQLGAKADQANTKIDQVNSKADLLAESEKRFLT